MSFMRAFWLAALMCLLSACATRIPPPAIETPGKAAAEAAWAKVLSTVVDERGWVDFEALAKNRTDLDRYVRHVADTRLTSLHDGAQRLAHMINAYNALSMFNVLDSGIPDSHAGLAKIRFFVLRKLVIGGQAMSLYRFENDVIRPLANAMNEPRVHFALNCSAVACPALPRRPFAGATLDAELERETRAFFARPENFRIEVSERRVWLSELLQFYAEDFVPAGAPSLLAYANRYAAQPAPADFEVRFTPYDWTIANSRRPR